MRRLPGRYWFNVALVTAVQALGTVLNSPGWNVLTNPALESGAASCRPIRNSTPATMSTTTSAATPQTQVIRDLRRERPAAGSRPAQPRAGIPRRRQAARPRCAARCRGIGPAGSPWAACRTWVAGIPAQPRRLISWPPSRDVAPKARQLAQCVVVPEARNIVEREARGPGACPPDQQSLAAGEP